MRPPVFLDAVPNIKSMILLFLALRRAPRPWALDSTICRGAVAAAIARQGFAAARAARSSTNEASAR
eukprot:8619663-Pyramimonas_sp.AAC.1